MAFLIMVDTNHPKKGHGFQDLLDIAKDLNSIFNEDLTEEQKKTALLAAHARSKGFVDDCLMPLILEFQGILKESTPSKRHGKLQDFVKKSRDGTDPLVKAFQDLERNSYILIAIQSMLYRCADESHEYGVDKDFCMEIGRFLSCGYVDLTTRLFAASEEQERRSCE